MRYDDWTISESHKSIVTDVVKDKMRAPILAASIRGIVGRRITDELQAGVWMRPLGSDVVRTFSSLHDVDRRTLLVAAVGKSTRQVENTPPIFDILEKIRTKFASRRVLGIIGELFSSHETSDYDIDDALARKYDIIQIVLSTRTREDR